jgi:RNA polymerase sigma factor for flagellar operon FliA
MWQGVPDFDLSSVVYEAGARELENAYRECEASLGRPATNLEVCEQLGVTLQELYELLERYRGLSLGRFEEIVTLEPQEDGGLMKYMPYTHDKEIFYVYSKSELRSSLAKAVEALPKNEQLVVSLLYHHKMKLAEIAGMVGFSEARVAQIHTTAMLRIRPKLLELRAKDPQTVLSSTHATPAA